MMTFSAFSGGVVYWIWSGFRFLSLLATIIGSFVGRVLHLTSAWVPCKDYFITTSSRGTVCRMLVGLQQAYVPVLGGFESLSQIRVPY